MVEMTGRRIRLVYHRKSVQSEASSDDPASLASSLKFLLSSNSVRSRRAVLNIPRHQAILKFVKLPSQEASEIGRMAKMEVLRQIPYSEEEIIHSHKTIRPEVDGYSLVLLAAVPKSIVDRFLLVLESCGLVADKVTLGAEIATEWFRENYPKTASQEVLLVNLSPDTLGVDVLQKGEWVFSRGISLDVSAKNTAQWLNEVEASVISYQKNPFSQLQTLYFFGLSSCSGDARRLAAELKLEFQEFGPLPNFGMIPEIGCSGKASIHFLPVKQDVQKNRVEWKKQVGFLLIGMGLIAALVGVGSWKREQNQKKLLAKIEAEIERNKPFVHTSASPADSSQRPLAADIFAEVHQLLPSKVMLEALDYEDHDVLTVRGSSDEITGIFEFSGAFKKSPWFSAVELKYVNKRPDSSQTNDFEIQAKIGK